MLQYVKFNWPRTDNNSSIFFLQKWVRMYRDTNLRVAIYTNNGIERQNKWLKYSYLEERRNSSISELIDVLLTQFLPDAYKK